MSNKGKVRAPRPGVGARIEAADLASKVVEVVMDDGQVYRFSPAAVGIADRAAVLAGVGQSFDWVFGLRVQGDGDEMEMVQTDEVDPILAMFVMWWIGRRRSGEPGLTFDQADTEFVDAVQHIKSADLVDPTGTDPEA